MSRSRGSEVPQRQSPRGPHQLRTSSVKNQPLAQRSSAKIGDRRTPQSNSSVNEKKFGTRVAELESQLGQAQNELKILKQQISETAKKEDTQPQTDVFQVSVEKVKIECVEVEKETKTVNEELGDKEKEVEVVVRANENLKKRLEEAAISISNSKAKEDEMMLKLSAVEEELEASKSISAKLKGKLDSVQGEKEALEAEMKLLRVQTEQWRKQADVAAAILSGGNGRISERCGSMEKHCGGVFEATGYMGSPGLGDDLDDGFGNGKRKGSGIKMFGELWKKKGQN